MLKKILFPLLLVSLLGACGKSESLSAAPAAAPAVATGASAPTVIDEALARGERVYKTACSLCHGTGAGGAPLFKSQAEWAPRIVQGKETLYQHALNGFIGAKGAMPPRGGNASLSDEDIKAGVDYMVSMAR